VSNNKPQRYWCLQSTAVEVCVTERQCMWDAVWIVAQRRWVAPIPRWRRRLSEERMALLPTKRRTESRHCTPQQINSMTGLL
jgi:hypothetical protein